MYEEEGQRVPDMVGQVYYNRGVFTAAIIIEGLRLAVENFGLPVTGEKVKMGYELITDFTLGGFLPPLTVTAQDHEGGGWVRIYETKGEEPWCRTPIGSRAIGTSCMDEVRKAGLQE